MFCAYDFSLVAHAGDFAVQVPGHFCDQSACVRVPKFVLWNEVAMNRIGREGTLLSACLEVPIANHHAIAEPPQWPSRSVEHERHRSWIGRAAVAVFNGPASRQTVLGNGRRGNGNLALLFRRDDLMAVSLNYVDSAIGVNVDFGN